jgi:hypothetical protein
MPIYEGTPPAFKTDQERQEQFIRAGGVEITESSENLPMPKIPQFPYENRKMSVEGMKKQLESECRCLVSPDQISQNLGLGKNGQVLPTSTGKKDMTQ